MTHAVTIFRSDDTAQMTFARYIREVVFCCEQDVPASVEWDGQDELCTHFLLFDDGVPIATARVRPYDGQTLKIERVAVLKERRGSAAGRAIMQAVLAFAASQHGHDRILLHAQIAVAGFYERFGFVGHGPVFSEADIPHVAMTLKND